MEWLLLLLLILGGRRPSKAPASDFASAWRARVLPLLERARSGARWAPLLAQNFGDDGAGAAAARWVGIESGGNPLAASKLKEVGLAQVMETSAPELGLSQAELRAMRDPATPDAVHAGLAGKVMRAEVAKARHRLPGVADWGPAELGLGKLRHGLPLLLKELQEQDLLRPSLQATVRLAASRYKPSQRAAKYATRVTGEAGKDLVLRFLATAAVVALGDGAADIGEPPGASS